ncbi:MAG: alpha/beta fold hydrolase, partial [Desulfobacterales bacterium]|nr:alpha/beta fold hydrolase [Desulfobacterales bacterium]
MHGLSGAKTYIKMDGDSRISLIMLPYAGASFYAYRDFQKYLPYPVEPRAVDLPGHGKRMREALLTDIRDMARDLFSQIQDELDGPYAIYGHSMGATLGYLLARLIVDQKTCRHPLHLFFSGRSGPALEEKKPRHTLPRDEFIAAVRDYGGMPPELLEHEGLLDFFLPILRADFQAAETYAHEPCAPLDIP